MNERHLKLTVAVAGSALLTVGAVMAIFLIGVRHVPDFPTLAEQPDPPLTGRLAYLTWTPEDDEASFGGPCLYVQDLGGERHTISCGDGSESGAATWRPDASIAWIGWDDAGHLLVAEHATTIDTPSEIVTIDVDTGDVLARDEVSAPRPPPDHSVSDDGARVSTVWRSDGWAEVWVSRPGERDRVLYRVRGPDGYSFWSAQWSPDGDFVLVSDSEQRTIAIAADGPPAPRVVLRNADMIAWYQPT